MHRPVHESEAPSLEPPGVLERQGLAMGVNEECPHRRGPHRQMLSELPSTAATRVFLPCPARSATNSAREPHAIGQTAPRRGSLGPPLADGAGADRPRASGPVPRVDPPGDRHECSHQSGSLPGRRDSPDADLEGAALRRLAWKSQARGGHARFDRLRPYGQMLRTQSRLAQRRHRRRRPGAESSPIAHPLACQLRLFL